MRRVAGLDLSLAGTAAVVLDDDGRPSAALVFSSVARDTLHRPAWLEVRRATSVPRGDAAADYHRTTGVADALRVFLRARLPTGSVVGIEDHAFGARGTAIYQLGHLHGIVRRDIVSALACRFLLLGVTEVKAAATGRGNAEKAEVVASAIGALGIEELSRATREALSDAYSVARLAWHLERLRDGRPLSSTPGDVARLITRGGLLDRPLIG